MTIALLVLALAVPQDVPRHPDELKYPRLTFEVPDASSMRVVLKGGVPAYLIEDPALPVVDLQVYVRAGSFSEPKGKEGLADLTASLMRTGGTTTRSPQALDEELEYLAANLSVGLGDVSGSVSLSVLSKDLARGLEILVDILRRPAFAPDRLETLKAQTIDGLKARNDSTARIEAREANRLFYGDYPLNRLPTRASVEGTTREDLIAFHRAAFHPSRFLVAAAGAFRKADLVAKLEAAFADWPAAEGAAPSVPPVPPEPKPGIHCFHKDGKNINQGRVTMGHLGLPVSHPDTQAVRVMSYILGAGGFSSRLMQKVRTEEGLAYDVRSDLRPGVGYPLPYKITFQSKSESCVRAAKLCLEELAKLQKEGPGEKELEAAKAFFLDAFPALYFATRIQTAATFAQAELHGLPKDYHREMRPRIAALSVADVKRVAVEHFRPERFTWIVVGNIPAIKAGDPEHPGTLADFGAVHDVPLPDPFTLERPPR
jgi:predicted Zn-dependent peptidase